MDQRLRNAISARLGIAALAVALIWLLVYAVIVPALIAQAYRGESIGFLNDIFSGRDAHPLETYLAAWHRLHARAVSLVIAAALGTAAFARALRAATGAPRPGGPPATIVNLAIVALLSAFVFGLYFFFPVGYVYFVTEDYWLEYASALGWIAASICAFRALRLDPKMRRPLLVLFAAGAFVAGMEEISWGQRIFGFSTPEEVRAVNAQGEMNLHNIGGMPSRHLVGAVVLGWGLLSELAAARTAALRRLFGLLGAPVVARDLWPLVLLTAAFLFKPFIPLGQEVGEMLVAVFAAVVALDVCFAAVSRASERTTAAQARVALVAGIALWAVALAGTFDSQRDEKRRLNDFAAIHYPTRGLYTQAEQVFDYIEQHPNLVRNDTALRHGLVLLRAGRREAGRARLDQAVAAQRLRVAVDPLDPEPHRMLGEALAALEHRSEADAAFARALALDEIHLQSPDARRRTAAGWSVAKTLLARGDLEGARAAAMAASAAAPDREAAGAINIWITGRLDSRR